MFKTLYLLAGILFVVSCTNLFSIRSDDVEKPDIGSNPYLEADEPRIILENFVKALNELNYTEYKDLFPDPAIIDNKPQPYQFLGTANFNDQLGIQSWGYPEEISFATDLFTDNSIETINVTFESDPVAIIQNDETHAETEFFKYNLSISYQNSPTRMYSGQMQLKLYQSTTESLLWYIYQWTDETDGDDPSISNLKIEIFSQ